MRTQGFGALAPQPVGPSSQLGKEQTLADAEDLFSRYGVWIRSIRQRAFTQERAQSVLNCLNTFKNRTAAPLKQFQRLLGHMAAAAAVTPLGLLHMRLLQHWLHGRVPRWAWQSGTLRVQVTPACRQTLTPWSDLSFLRAGVPLEQVSRYAVVYTDASAKGWGAMLNGLAVSGVWTGPQLHWHIKQLPRVAGSTPGLEPSQETLTRRARTGPHGQHCDRCVHQPTRWSTLPSHVATRPPPPPPLESEVSEVASRHSYSGLAQPDSRRAVTSCAPRRMETPSPDGPANLATFWTHTGRPVHVPRDVALPVVLLPDRRNTRHGRTVTVAYINRQGGLRSHRMSQLARHLLLLWSRKHLRSLRAIHIPGLLNRTADELSRAALPGEWRLHPQTVQLIWRRFGLTQVDLFTSLETSHCHLFYSLTEGTLGTDALAHSWPRGLRKYAFPPVSRLAQALCKVREEEEQILLVAPYWPTRTWFPELMLLVTAPPWQIPLRKDLLPQRRGTLWHPRPDLWELHVWSLDGTRRF